MPHSKDRLKDKKLWTGSRLKEARRAERMTLDDVQRASATTLGHSATWLSDIERGANSIDPHDLLILASLYKRPIEWFLDKGYDSRPAIEMPKTVYQWERCYTDTERAHAHWELDRLFDRLFEGLVQRFEAGKP